MESFLQGTLFETEEAPDFPRRDLASKLKRLAEDSILIGTSSWKYDGWLGQVYRRERYQARGRFSRKRFQDNCIAEYAETFPVVSGDFSFYQFPSSEYWARLFGVAPPTLRFALKVPEEITAKAWPRHERYGAKAGYGNPSFLDGELVRSGFTEPLRPYHERVAVLIFQFGSLSHSVYPDGVHGFASELGQFLDGLPADLQYAVEIRNRQFLEPVYFECLRDHNVAHVYSSWTHMPELSEQVGIAEALTADFVVCRALLRPGRNYSQAVEKFRPYDKLTEPYPRGREGIKRSIALAQGKQLPAYIFVNNRFEGSAPRTISAVVNDL